MKKQKDYIDTLEKIVEYFSDTVSTNGVEYEPYNDTIRWICKHCGGKGLQFTRNIQHSDRCIVFLFKKARLLKKIID